MPRATRYTIHVVRNDDTTTDIQANARRKDALRRAAFVARDRRGWPSVTECYVRDTMPEMIDGRFIHVIAAFTRTNEAQS